MDYNPKDAANVIGAGDYDADLVKVEETTSKSSGNPMEVWTFRVYGDREILVKDYVTVPACTFKIRQLAVALNKKADFEAGTFQAVNYIGAGVVAEVIVEAQDGFDDQNKIKKVKAPKATTAAPAPQRQAARPAAPQRKVESPVTPAGTGIPEEDIPFAPNVC